MHWNYKRTDPPEGYEDLKVTSLVARVLQNRSIDPETARLLFHKPEELLQSPHELGNSRQAAEKILEHTTSERTEIWVYADYDVDGLASGYMMTDYLREISQNGVYVYYPNREEGYGLNMEFCKIIADRQNARDIDKILVITVDNGVSCADEINFLRTAGIETVVVDHHLPKANLPDCIIVNPHVEDESVYKHLSGCGVVLKLIQSMDPEAASSYYFAVALGTIADVMPAHVENMALVKLGLDQLNAGECPKGFRTLRKKVLDEPYNVDNISWTIAPLLNACGRMGDIDKGAQVFFSDPLTDQEVTDIILEIEELNETRREYTRQAQKALEKLDFSLEPACFFDVSGYHSGISGPLASTLSEKYNKPAFVYTVEDGEVTGSARSADEVNVEALLARQKEQENIDSFGGHSFAAGFSLSEDKLEDFRQGVADYLKEISPEEKEPEELQIDCSIGLQELSKKNYEQLNSIYYDAPPMLAIKNLKVKKVHPSKNNPDNIKLTLEDSKKRRVDIWAWRMGSLYKELGSPEKIDIAGSLDKEFMKSGVTLKVSSLRRSKKSLSPAKGTLRKAQEK